MLSEEELLARIAAVPVWFHNIELAPGIVTPGRDNSATKLQRLNIPEDLSGKRVLDIGANDGFFSFLCERRGATVIAIDHNPTPGFRVAHEVLGSKVEFHTLDIYDLSPATFGQFDLVFCLGVLYHLRHPLLALERIRSVCKDLLILETQICDHYFLDTNNLPHDLAQIAPLMLTVPMAQFYPGAELNGDPTNWWSPNLLALDGMLQSTGFISQQTIVDGGRVCIHCTVAEQSWAAAWIPTNAVTDGHEPVYRLLEAGGTSLDRTTTDTNPTALQTTVDSLAQSVKAQSYLNLHLQQTVAQRDMHIADLEARSRWLEEQAHEARRALAAVENGRVLRLVRLLTRK
jgi:tRNA (mo5U34)-methyltransferase